MSTQSGEVWVFAEQEGCKLSGIAFELLGKARELADKLGVNQCTVSDYETGQVELTLPKLVRIADALGVTIPAEYEAIA